MMHFGLGSGAYGERRYIRRVGGDLLLAVASGGIGCPCQATTRKDSHLPQICREAIVSARKQFPQNPSKKKQRIITLPTHQNKNEKHQYFVFTKMTFGTTKAARHQEQSKTT